MTAHVHDWRPDPLAPGGINRREWLKRRICACGARARVRDGAIVQLKTQPTRRPEPTVNLSGDADWMGWRERHGGAE